MTDWIKIAVINGVWGIKGLNKIKSFVSRDFFADCTALPVLVRMGDQEQETVIDITPHKNHFLIQIKGCDDANKAGSVIGAQLYVERKIIESVNVRDDDGQQKEGIKDEEILHMDLLEKPVFVRSFIIKDDCFVNKSSAPKGDGSHESMDQKAGKIKAFHDFGAGEIIEITLDSGESVMIPNNDRYVIHLTQEGLIIIPQALDDFSK